MPTLSDGWLSGFTDAEGCFYVSIVKQKAKLTIIGSIPKLPFFCLCKNQRQKGELAPPSIPPVTPKLPLAFAYPLRGAKERQKGAG